MFQAFDSGRPAKGWAAFVALSMLIGLGADLSVGSADTREGAFDTALILAVDVSDSIDAMRYRLQMEGIARALEDEGVIEGITNGAKGGILLSVVAWADSAEIAMPWQAIRSADDAQRVAGIIRSLEHRTGEFTCVAYMLRFIEASVLSTLPARPTRLVLDVSGDGIDNCAVHAASDDARDALLGKGVTINGLPIIVKGENEVVGAGTFRKPGFAFEDLGPDRDATTLDAWYRAHVVGGPASFQITALGFEDFGRAFRQKFVAEISGLETRLVREGE